MVPSKRPREPSFTDKHSDYSETHAASDWIQEKQLGEVDVKNFLELCGFCKKNLGHDNDVFMYGYLGAYCSKKCRLKQMACDIFRESWREIVKTKKRKTCEEIKPKDSNDEVSENRDRPLFFI